jgi:mannose-6-phosphate isomerase-like protein (cupin superfamily)
MININDYINSGNLEQHCFDIFNEEQAREVIALSQEYPEVKQELKNVEDTIEKIAESGAIDPPARLRNSILEVLGFQADVIDLANLPATSEYSSYTAWLNAVEHLLPAEPFDDFFAHLLRQDEHIAQTLVVTKLNVPEEFHEEVAESFFILKGQCACTVGDKVFTLNAGDHLEIPLHVNHDIKILSPYVIAILQHRFA